MRVRQVAWERLDGSTTEQSQISEGEDGVALTGHVTGAVDGQRIACVYAIGCSTAWLTETVRVDLACGRDKRLLLLRRDEDGRWWQGDDELRSFRGIADIDLSITPMTNCLPIRRLELDVGASAEVDALWVGFPELVLERLTQRYTRLGEQQYRYESVGGDFSAVLDVDSHGVVTRYGDLWQASGGNE